jgi:hypothetical protein
MTIDTQEPTLSPEEALEQNDISLALTPAQLVLAFIGLWLFFKLIRSFRR